MESEKLGMPLLAIYSLFWGIAIASRNMVLTPVLILIAILSYALFKRQVTNMAYSNFPRLKNKYIVVYFIKSAVRLPLKFFVIPDETGYGIIEAGRYKLEKENALPDDPSFKGRLHFIVEEGNPLPVQAEIEEIQKSKILFRHEGKIFFEGVHKYNLSDPDKDILRTLAFSFHRSLVTTWFKILYAEVKQWAFIIAMIGLVAAVAVSLYEFQYIQSVNPLVQQIYQRTIIENGSMYIHQGSP